MANMDTINVLMLLPDLKVANGVSSFAMNYFRKIDHHHIKIDFVVFFPGESPYCDEIIAAGSKIFTIPSVKHPIDHIRMCMKIIEEGNYRIIHDNSLLVTTPMMWCALKYQIPARILHSHNSELGETPFKEKRNKLFLPFLRSCANKYAACSNLAGKAMFGNRKFEFIPNVVDVTTNKYDFKVRTDIRNKMGASDKFVIVTVGRTAPQKNPFFAIDVFAKLLDQNSNVEYWWIGSGPLEQELSQYVQDKKIQNHVKLLGSRTDVKNLYQAADCFFLPSLFEGLPVTALEAQAFGLPCVISDTVTNELVYTDLVEFVPLQVGAEAWAQNILQISQKKIDRLKYNEKLRNSNFSSEQAATLLTRFYEEMLRRN